MRYLSVCSGIEAATVAWHPLGWRAVAYSEVDKFPSAVLAHHYPDVPNLGDMTKYQEWPDAIIDVLVGGTPCQSFSVAGLRKGLDDPRGNLMLTFGAIAGRYRPQWLVWENVPGVLSSNRGRDFGAFLGMLGELGYGFAYRILDAQFCGVPQRRRRVFVVGCLGDWRRAAAVLFERHSLSWHPPPRRESGQDVAGSTGRGVAFGGNNTSGPIDVSAALNACHTASGRQDFETETFVAHTLRGAGFDASEDGTGRGTPLVPIAIQAGAIKSNPDIGPDGVGVRTDGMAYTLDARAEVQAVAVALRGRDGGATAELGDEVGNCLRAAQGGGDKPHVLTAMTVRRLTPVECERLQGFPDGYTAIPWRGRPADQCPDGPRYKALGNSMAVPCMRWIGERIGMVEAIGEAA